MRASMAASMADRCEDCPLDALLEEIAEHIARRGKRERLVPPNEAAQRLGWSRKTLDRRRDLLPFVRRRESGRGYDVIESALEAWMRRRR
jgi:hypothetical protein